ncbi:hypothetical protein HBI67_026930 [Parastagonospora nodorum]|nr:hypothetical protein HBI66_070630 [Parastagonospora nodorum]KAH6083708.1 hypothetical protein HBI67_026930 [Parastagonospora nodorum]
MRSSPEPIAIVGMSCRFSGGSSNPAKLWELIASRKDGWSPIPEARFDGSAFYHPDQQKHGLHNVRGANFLDEDVNLFDAQFFNVTTEAAKTMDPQLRFLLEGVFEALENAGLPLENIAGSNTSVFSGAFSHDHQDSIIADPENVSSTFMTGNGTAMFSNRVSHFFNLKGPSLTIDTGCSASLAAIHLAIQSIRNRESDISIVCASALMFNPDMFIALCRIGVLSPEGKSFSLDARADGYGRGEGAAALVLKPLSAAKRDGDFIHAVIRESSMNQDGRTATITSPSGDVQQALIRDCYNKAGIDMSSTCYVEGHFTGTIADAIEAEAIGSTIGEARKPHPLYVGTIKPNIGHTEPVSGIASIIKVALMLRHKLIPPNAHFETPNPRIAFSRWNLHVPTSLISWPDDPLRASVNNFGYGGTNVHVIMEAYSCDQIREDTNGKNGNCNEKIKAQTPLSYVYLVSSKEESGVQAMSQTLAKYIRMVEGNKAQANDNYAPALAYTLTKRRSRFPYTAAVRAGSLDQLATRLEDPHITVRKAPTDNCRIGFVFNGQGGQWHAMGRGLVDAYPAYKQAMERADWTLQHLYHAPWSLMEEMTRDEGTSRMHEIGLSPAISVALQLCLVDLLRTWACFPSAVVSHSSGEIAAAYAASVISFEEALGIAYHRGRLSEKHQQIHALQGGMLAVRLSAESVKEYIAEVSKGAEDRIGIACVNSPSSVTLSGDIEALLKIAALLEEDAVVCRKLNVGCAYHSSHMLHMAEDYEKAINSVFSSPTSSGGRVAQVPFASPVTGSVMSDAFLPEHWVRNLTNPVLFSQALQSMMGHGQIDVILEIGPQATLSGPIRQTLRDSTPTYLSCLRHSVNAVDSMQDVACGLSMAGYPLMLDQVNLIPEHQRIHLSDIPSYTWNHRSRYLLEPRMAADHRHPKFPFHELLGLPVPGSNPLQPTFRNVLRAEDVSWLADHQLQGETVLPAAGYVSMAIEALHFLNRAAGIDKLLVGYKLRNVDITSALVVPALSSGVDIVFSLRPCSKKELDHESWYEFDLFSVDNSIWVQHCRGYVGAEKKSASKTGLSVSNSQPNVDNFLTGYEEPSLVTADAVFSSLRGMEFYHGPCFQNLADSKVLGRKSITQFRIAPVASNKEGSKTSAILHATTLDSIFQSCYSGLAAQLEQGDILIPRSIDFISVPIKTAQSLQALAELTSWTKRHVDFHAWVVPGRLEHDEHGDESLPFQIKGFRLQMMHQRGTRESEHAQPDKRLHAKCRWELDIHHGIPTEIKESMRFWPSERLIESQSRLRRACGYMIVDAYRQLQQDDIAQWDWHYKKFYKWMGSVVHGLNDNINEDEASKQLLFESVAAEDAVGDLTCRIGMQLANIVRGHVAPLELMRENDLLNQYYQQMPQLVHGSYKQVERILRLYAAREPGASVLEIGAGTGGTTRHVLEAFSDSMSVDGGDDEDGSGSSSIKTSLLGHYDFTDISAGFFGPAKEIFKDWDHLMDFRILDIGSDPQHQGFAAHSYDLIVAAQVLHATANLERTLANVRKLLRPGGKLLMLESTQDALDAQLVFGTLPGWWLGEDSGRESSPNVGLECWDRVLKATGFSGIDFELNDCENAMMHSTSLILATAQSDQEVRMLPSTVHILHDTNSSVQTAWLEELKQAVTAQTGGTVKLQRINEVRDITADDVVMVTVDMDSAFLYAMGPSGFETLRNIVLRSYGVLWLSCGGVIDASMPQRALVQGLFRTLRREDTSKRYVHLDFSSSTNPWTSETVRHAVHVFQDAFDQNKDVSTTRMDWEYGVKDGLLHVPRLWPDFAQDGLLCEKRMSTQKRPWYEQDRELVWEVPDAGRNQTRFIERNMSDDSLAEDVVEIEAQAFGINFKDVMTAMGLIEEDGDFVGHESAGIVTRLGNDTVQSGLRVGDRVCGIFRGRFASRPQARWTSVVAVPESMSLDNAVSIPYAYGTAHLALHHVARLQRGERVLIHSAAGALGQAAITLAQQMDADLFVTCSSSRKRTLLMMQYGIPANRVFSSRSDTFAAAIMTQTSGHGVDVVLNSLRGALLQASWHCIARFGRFVELGKVDAEAQRTLNMLPFRRSASLTALDLIQYSECKSKTAVLHAALRDSIQLLNARQRPPMTPITSLPVSALDQAMQSMRTGQHMGKLVLRTGPDDRVRVKPRDLKPICLDDVDATYLVLGGLGGVGYAITSWMVEKAGARNILVVSRTAESHHRRPALEKLAAAHGCAIHVRNCDVSDADAVHALLANVARSPIPPIAGVIHGTVVLDDSILEHMSFDQWRRVAQPKTISAWILHEQLPHLRFFVMLSSATGILGHASQGNYVAGNTFHDALARHRTARGLPAVSIDLGPIEDAGYLAERSEELRRKTEKSLSMKCIPVSHVLRAVEDAIRHPLRSRPEESQIVTCMARYDTLPALPTLLNDNRLGTLRFGNVADPTSATAKQQIGPVAKQVKDVDRFVSDLTSIRDSHNDIEGRHQAIVAATSLFLAAKIASFFNRTVQDIEPSVPLTFHGVDSLVAVDFRNWLGNILTVKLSIFEILNAISLTHIAGVIATKSPIIQTSGYPATTT